MLHVCFFLLISLSGRRENISPDYPLTLLEGLTTITHYCLLDNKRVRNETHIPRCTSYIYHMTFPSFFLSLSVLTHLRSCEYP